MRRCDILSPGLPRQNGTLLALAAVGFFLLAATGCNQDQPLATDPTQAETTTDTATVVVTDSTGDQADGVDRSLPALTSSTTLYPGQDLQAAVNSNPGGTTFTLKAGVHRLQSITPKGGDKFVGEVVPHVAVEPLCHLRQEQAKWKQRIARRL